MTVKKDKNLSLCSCSSISFLVVLTLDFSHKIPEVDFFFVGHKCVGFLRHASLMVQEHILVFLKKIIKTELLAL